MRKNAVKKFFILLFTISIKLSPHLQCSAEISALTSLRSAIENLDFSNNSERKIRFLVVKRRIESEFTISSLQTDIASVFDNIEGALPSDQSFIDKNGWTFVIFSEYFWGNCTAIQDNLFVDQVIQKANELSSRHPRLVIFLHFLHRFLKSDTRPHLTGFSQINPRQLPQRVLKTDLPKQTTQTFVSDNEKRIANYTLIVWFGKPIAIYRKSTYFNEGDTYITNNSDKYTYEFGNFTTKSLINDASEHRRIAEVFTGTNHLIQNRICSDMNEQFLTESGSPITIVQSHHKRPYLLARNGVRLLDNSNIIFADTFFGPMYIPSNQSFVQSLPSGCLLGTNQASEAELSSVGDRDQESLGYSETQEQVHMEQAVIEPNFEFLSRSNMTLENPTENEVPVAQGRPPFAIYDVLPQCTFSTNLTLRYIEDADHCRCCDIY